MGERILMNGYELRPAGEDLVDAIESQIPVVGSIIEGRHNNGYFIGEVKKIYYDDKHEDMVVLYRPHTFVEMEGDKIASVRHQKHIKKITPMNAKDEFGKKLIKVVG